MSMLRTIVRSDNPSRSQGLIMCDVDDPSQASSQENGCTHTCIFLQMGTRDPNTLCAAIRKQNLDMTCTPWKHSKMVILRVDKIKKHKAACNFIRSCDRSRSHRLLPPVYKALTNCNNPSLQDSLMTAPHCKRALSRRPSTDPQSCKTERSASWDYKQLRRGTMLRPRTIGSDRHVVLADLVPLGQIGVEILLAVELGLRGNGAIKAQSRRHCQSHHLVIYHRQSPLHVTRSKLSFKMVHSPSHVCSCLWEYITSRSSLACLNALLFCRM